MSDQPLFIHEDLLTLPASYSEFSVKLADSYESYLERLAEFEPRTEYPVKSAEVARDIYQVPDVLADIIDRQQDIENIHKPDRVEFRAEHSDIPFEREVITWEIISRRPGTVSQGKPNNGGVRQLVPTQFAVVDDKFNAGHKIVIFGQWFDNELQLTCWAPNSETANKRAQWLEDTLLSFNWYLALRGVDRVIFNRRTRGIARKDPDIYGVPLLYDIRTQKLLVTRLATIKEVLLEVGGVAPPALLEEYVND